MSSGTGSGFIDDVLNVGLQIGTAGFVGYGEEGFQGGYSAEAIKEVTGANAAEEANKLAREQFEEETAQALEDRQNQITQNRQRQTQASQTAGAVRNRSTTSNSSSSSTTNTSNLGGETDFLGL